MFNKTLSRGRAIADRYVFSHFERELFAAYRASGSGPSGDESAPLVAVQRVEDPFYLGTFRAVVLALRESCPVRCEQYAIRSFRIGITKSAAHFVWAVLQTNWLTDYKWTRLFGTFCDRVGVRSAAWLSPVAELRIWWQSYRLWRGLKSKDDLKALTLRGILIGDLVTDSFVRFKPWPELLLNDIYLWTVLRQALRELDKAISYFSDKKPALYLTSYTSYVQHGIPARVAISLGVQVVAFGNYQQFAKLLDAEDDTHLARHWEYRERFRALPQDEQARHISLAEAKLSARLRGEIDNAIGYMRSSAYARQDIATMPDVRNAYIIYLPDFFDSIHVYRWCAFADFWEWFCFTVNALKENNIRFFVKPHPNGFSETNAVYAMIRSQMPDVEFLPPGLTTTQLVEGGMACGVSARGTILSELAYLGIPGLACGDHPHADFDQTPPPRTREEYRKRLLVCEQPTDIASMREGACAFYYMHNLSLDSDAQTLRDLSLKLRAQTATLEALTHCCSVELVGQFHNLAQLPDFHRFIVELKVRMRGNSVPLEKPQAQPRFQNNPHRPKLGGGSQIRTSNH